MFKLGLVCWTFKVNRLKKKSWHDQIWGGAVTLLPAPAPAGSSACDPEAVKVISEQAAQIVSGA